jgi:4,5-dihydroxyphthalate decarboxylase
MAKYIARRSRGDSSLVAIPVFPSRVFRHSSIFVRPGTLTDPRELAGRRVGIPEWAQTAAIWTRALLVHEYGVRLQDIEWVQAGVNRPGRKEKVDLDLPEGVTVRTEPDRSLDDLLRRKDVDAILTAHPPRSFELGDPEVVRLFDDPEPVERDYAARTGIFPIMHIIAIKGSVYQRHPWVAANLLSAFTRAKDNSVARLRELTASRIPLPWTPEVLDRSHELLFSEEYWPYGVEPNHVTLDAFARYAHEQGVASRLMRPEELFAPEVLSSFKV